MRGRQRPGDYNHQVLITLNGHSLNGSVFGDGLFGSAPGLDMESVERIDVVRGPGSALYGTHAVLAVVNVVTRPPSRESGVTVSGRTDGRGEGRVFASIASPPPGRPQWFVSGSWLDARLGLRIGRGAEAGVEARNLFDARHGDARSEERVEDPIMRDGRVLYATLTYRPALRP